MLFVILEICQLVVMLLMVAGILYYFWHSTVHNLEERYCTIIFKKKDARISQINYMQQLPKYYLSSFRHIENIKIVDYDKSKKMFGKFDVKMDRLSITKDYYDFAFDTPIIARCIISGSYICTQKINQITVYLECLPGTDWLVSNKYRYDTAIVT